MSSIRVGRIIRSCEWGCGMRLLASPQRAGLGSEKAGPQFLKVTARFVAATQAPFCGLFLSSLLLSASCIAAATLHYQADASGPWPAIFSSIGLTPGREGVVVASPDSSPDGLAARVESGTILIV